MFIGKRRFRGLLYSLALASATFLSSGVMATMPPVAFKGISRYFKVRSLDPTLGQIGLETGEIYDVHFDDSFEDGLS